MLRTLRLTVFDRLATYLTHEMSQPISISRITAENVLHDLNTGNVSTDTLRERLTTIHDQAERMTGAIERLMHLGNRQPGVSARFDICKTLDETASALRRAAVMSGLTFEVSAPDEPTFVHGSPRNLWLVMVGLLTMTWDPGQTRRGATTNASGSGILIHAERRKSTVALDLIHDGCEATGQPGSAAGQFAGDIRVETARRVIERMEGRFEAKFRDNGLHVRIVLPLTDHVAAAAPAEGSKTARSRNIRPLNVLLVDDEELALEGIQEYLSRQGHHIVTACNGSEALLRFAELPIDVVVTDLRMPIMDGNTLIREIRRQSPLPIIAMTGHAGPTDEEVALSDGASVVLHKPVRLRDLASALEKATTAP